MSCRQAVTEHIVIVFSGQGVIKIFQMLIKLNLNKMILIIFLNIVALSGGFY